MSTKTKLVSIYHLVRQITEIFNRRSKRVIGRMLKRIEKAALPPDKIVATTFPQEGKKLSSLLFSLLTIARRLAADKRNGKRVGYLITYPTNLARISWSLLSAFNPGNLGNWSIAGKKINNLTGRFEARVIAQMINLFGTSLNEMEGYFTSGGTEGNLFCAWTGRNKLLARVKRDEVCLIKNDLTHYSLDKIADLINVKTFNSPLRDDFQGFDVSELSSTVTELIQLGYKGFLIPLTIGFTLTGTNDDIKSIVQGLSSLQKKYPSCHFFCWVDAALSGLVQPFIRPDLLLFDNEFINGVVVDFHKFGQVPLPAGLVLYKKSLRKLIERPIGYLEEDDNTISGSRTGISAVAVWANINYWGKLGFRKKILKLLNDKNSFINQYKAQTDLYIISDDNNLHLGVLIKKNKKKWVRYFSHKYDMIFKEQTIHFKEGKKKLLIGKAFFVQ